MEYCDRCSWDETNEIRQPVIVKIAMTDLDSVVLDHYALCQMCWNYIKLELN